MIVYLIKIQDIFQQSYYWWIHFFASLLNLFKINEKLEYHKLKASGYIRLSNEIEEYISFGEEIDTTVRLYKTYMTYCNDNEYIVPERIIKDAETH